MKSDPLYISKLYLFYKEDLYDGIQNDEIIFKTASMEGFDYTPGTAFYDYEGKNSVSGGFFSKTVTFSLPGIPESVDLQKLSKVRAVVAVCNSGSVVKNMVLYKNDYFSNTPLPVIVSGSLDKISVKITSTCLD